MSRTITALFDTRPDADAGRQRLIDAHLHADNIKIHDKSSVGEAGYSSDTQPGMWASIKNAFLPNEDRHTYEEGVRRGGFLLTADVDEDQADEAVRALDDAYAKGVDIDERANQWKSQGWKPPVTSAGVVGAAVRPAGDQDVRVKGKNGEEEHFDVIEEQLVVGKREVDRGGVRVRSYVTEKPVHEQIRLRNENVTVERHPVNRPIGDDAFQERSIEMTETDEEAVVGKKARIVEEVVIKKTADEHIEEINETVRHTDVNVEKFGGGGDSSQSREQPKPGFGEKMKGIVEEGIGNTKQGIAGLTDNESLKQNGSAQERKGEMQQGNVPDQRS